MKQSLFIAISCLAVMRLISSEPPSPRDGRDAGQKTFIERLHKRAADRNVNLPQTGIIPRTQELPEGEFQAHVDAALQKLDQQTRNPKK